VFDFCDWVISLASPCVPMFAPISCPHIFSYDVSHKWFFNSCVRVVMCLVLRPYVCVAGSRSPRF
jgi:hypothetical protein